MERDPVRFVWRAAPGLNIALLVLAVAAIPCVLAAGSLLSAAIDDVALGRAFEAGRRHVAFGRLVLPLPRVSEGGLVLFPGIALGRDGHFAAIVGGLVALAVGAGVFSAAFGAIRVGVGSLATEALTRRILAGIASAPVSAAQTAQRSAAAASEALVGQRGFLGSAAGAPALALAVLLASLLWLAGADWRLALVTILCLAAYACAEGLRERTRRDLTAADAEADGALRRSVADLAQHLSALAAHGTAAHEQQRISDEVRPARQGAVEAERWAAAVSGFMLAVAVGVSVAAFVLALWLGSAGAISPGQTAVAAGASALALGALRRILRWRRELELVRPAFAEIARHLGSFHARRRDGDATRLPATGRLVASGLSADGSIQGSRLAGLDLSVELPAHVALVGDAGSGVRSFAGLLGGQGVPRSGAIALGGVDLTTADASDRAVRLAFAGGETFLFPGTLEANLLYGCRDPGAADIETRLAEAVRIAGLSGVVYRRGLATPVDTRRERELGDVIVAARQPLRAALAKAGVADRVQPFDPEAYNPHATIGENILFGIALGDTFRDENLSAHAFMRELLEREDLAGPLSALGAAIVRSTLEMFWGVSSRSTIVSRFAILSPAELGEFEAILDRQGQGRGAASARDAARLIGLALRYSEIRHRLGLMSPDLPARILRVRQAFRRSVPKSLEPAIEFFDPGRLCAAASVLDNLLFGRIVEDRAEARAEVMAVVRAELETLGLTGEIIRIGLRARIDPLLNGLSSSQLAAVDLVRCLVRQPDNLVVQRALDELPPERAVELARRLVAAMDGKGLLLVLPRQASEAAPLFDRVVTFEAGRIASDEPVRWRAAASRAEPANPDAGSPASLVVAGE